MVDDNQKLESKEKKFFMKKYGYSFLIKTDQATYVEASLLYKDRSQSIVALAKFNPEDQKFSLGYGVALAINRCVKIYTARYIESYKRHFEGLMNKVKGIKFACDVRLEKFKLNLEISR